MTRVFSRAIDLAGFEAKFGADADPWGTFTDRDEARKRRAILRALGAGRVARVLEVASGNGSNTAALARRALYLEACDGTARGVELTRQAVAGRRRVRVYRLALPARLPRPRYDAVVIAELLYYLAPRQMRRFARETARVLRPGGRLVLAHHHIGFPDTAQRPAGVHGRFLHAANRPWERCFHRRNGRWRVGAWVLARR